MQLPFLPPSWMPDILASLALLSTLLVAWRIANQTLQARKELSKQVSRRWSANVRNTLLLIAMIGLIMIWAPQLRTFALSLTAVAVAIVVAFKELLLCLSGAALRTLTRAYAIGDFIEINGIRGEVVDISLLATRLREINRRGSSTLPRLTVFPHSLMFTHPVRVLAHEGTLAEHGFALVFETKVDLFCRRDELTRTAISAWKKETSQAATGKPMTLDGLSTSVSTTDLGRIKVEISYRTQPEHASAVEHAIAAGVGSFVFSLEAAQQGCNAAN